MEDGLGSSFERLLADPGIEAVIRRLATEAVDHRTIALPFSSATQAAELARREAELSGSRSRGQKAILNLSQNRQTISLSNAQCQHLLPRLN